jgi:ornithine cyclodeaminase/alanine dehydrogenase-like protein (mu-crystallin family)
MTDASEPVFFGEWFSPGQHVTSVLGGNTPRDSQGRPLKSPRRDLDDEAIRRSDILVINSRAQAEQDWQGDIVVPIEKGIVGWQRIYELSELVGGKVQGRKDARQITLYKNNGAQGVADVALAAFAANKAREKGLGIEV